MHKFRQGRVMHEYYTGKTVNVQAIHDDAWRRAIAKRDPESSIVHLHSFIGPCSKAVDDSHAFYWAGVGLVTDESAFTFEGFREMG